MPWRGTAIFQPWIFTCRTTLDPITRQWRIWIAGRADCDCEPHALPTAIKPATTSAANALAMSEV
jgi:hypothetical protein